MDWTQSGLIATHDKTRRLLLFLMQTVINRFCTIMSARMPISGMPRNEKLMPSEKQRHRCIVPVAEPLPSSSVGDDMAAQEADRRRFQVESNNEVTSCTSTFLSLNPRALCSDTVIPTSELVEDSASSTVFSFTPDLGKFIRGSGSSNSARQQKQVTLQRNAVKVQPMSTETLGQRAWDKCYFCYYCLLAVRRLPWHLYAGKK